MIVKMKFINISGPRDDIDRVTDLYLSRYEIQLESALSELKTVDNLRPFVELNPYRDVLAQATQFVGYLPNVDDVTPDDSLGLDDMFEVVRKACEDYEGLQAKKEKKKAKIEELRAKQQLLSPFRPLDCDLHKVLGYRYITYRFGRIALESYHKMNKYLMDDLSAIFVEGERDESFVYGAYFVSPGEAQKVDAVFRSLHFERIELKDEFEGTPAFAYQSLERDIARINLEIQDLDKEAGEMLSDRAPQLIAAKNRLEELSKNFDIRKMAARMKDSQDDSYILCGWMAEDDVEKFLEEIKDDDKVFVVVEDDHDAYFGEPPTKLENPKLFKPFEMYIQMYGLPAHNEMDPTIFVAITYSFIFGVMFGSIFGFEDIIEPLWIRPIDHMTTLPFLGKLNTVFIVAVAFGMFLIIVAMILHIINAARSKDIESTWFDPNGVAGLIFYIAVVATIVLFMTGNPLPGGIVMGIMFGVPLLLIFLREPLTRMIEKRADKMETGPGMYAVQGFFEMFETLLSYFSNTISFIRIGAFAVSHAAIMEVVLQLAGAESGNPNWFGVIFGNLFVCGFEGLIVGIQVLRLEYYEMFSRFYKGSGRAFDPYTKKKTK